MPPRSRAGLTLFAGVLGAVATHFAVPEVVTLEPGNAAWAGWVGGATPSGRVLERAVVRLPGIRRHDRGQVQIRLQARTELQIATDGGPLERVITSRDGEVVIELPRSATPGARIDLVPVAGSGPFAIESVLVTPPPRSRWPVVLAFLASGIATATLSFATGLAVAGMITLAFSGALSPWITPLALLVASVSLGARRVSYWKELAVAASVILGLWARLYFLPSAGSWDTEYWKAWMTRAVDRGTSRVYGESDAVPDGELFDQMLGRTELWKTRYRGRDFVVDYPPLAMELWRWSWFAVSTLAPGLERGEAENVAVKLPSVFGDLVAVVLLLWLFRRDRPRGITLAALYWALPLSWLSSAVLGYLDGAYAPFAVGAVIAASVARPAWAGALVAVAALIKPQAVIVAPAAAVALGSVPSIRRAVAFGLGTVAIALVPFVVAGTLEEAVVHVFRILFQQRLSAGYANLWWLVGNIVSDEAYAPFDALPFSPSLVALPAFGLAAVFICRRSRDACLAAGGLVFAYAMLALGVHHNHPHVMFLAFAATGLAGARQAWFAGLLGVSYVLNMLAIEGLGRFYGTRYMAVEPLAAAASGLRMAFGFDLLLLLGVVNALLFTTFLLSLRRHG